MDQLALEANFARIEAAIAARPNIRMVGAVTIGFTRNNVFVTVDVKFPRKRKALHVGEAGTTIDGAVDAWIAGLDHWIAAWA